MKVLRIIRERSMDHVAEAFGLTRCDGILRVIQRRLADQVRTKLVFVSRYVSKTQMIDRTVAEIARVEFSHEAHEGNSASYRYSCDALRRQPGSTAID
jgi:hypothetical protein